MSTRVEYVVSCDHAKCLRSLRLSQVPTRERLNRSGWVLHLFKVHPVANPEAVEEHKQLLCPTHAEQLDDYLGPMTAQTAMETSVANSWLTEAFRFPRVTEPTS